jgi:hypothetical protein
VRARLRDERAREAVREYEPKSHSLIAIAKGFIIDSSDSIDRRQQNMSTDEELLVGLKR